MTRDEYVEFSVTMLDAEGKPHTLSDVMKYANSIALNMGDTYVFPDFEIKLTQFMEKANISDRERNLLTIQQDFCTAYKALHVSVLGLGEELNPYYEQLVRRVYEALVDECQSALLTEGLTDDILIRYLVGGLNGFKST